MFIGHFAVGLAGKRAVPRASLGTLFMAVQLADLLWPALLLAGVEHVRIAPGITAVTPLDFTDYPVSHSLVTSLAWGAGFAGVYFLVRRDWRAALILGACVVSHWVLDFASHRPDVPLYPGGPRLGLGLWYSLPLTVAVEGALFTLGVLVYLRSTTASDRTGVIAFWSLIAFLLVAYFSSILGPPPPNERFLAWFANSGWLLVAWGYWIDRHRTLRAR